MLKRKGSLTHKKSEGDIQKRTYAPPHCVISQKYESEEIKRSSSSHFHKMKRSQFGEAQRGSKLTMWDETTTSAIFRKSVL